MKLKFFYNSIKRFSGIFVLILLVLCCLMPCYRISRTCAAQKRIAKKVIRLHVLANSDSENDQRLKLCVKQGILEYLQNELGNTDSREEALAKIQGLFPELQNISEKILRENGCYDSVKICLEETDFPEKTYGEFTFPPGNYTALRVLIGSGNGHNWWCVLFPSLCYVDETLKAVPDEPKEKLKKSLSYEDYKSLLKSSDTKVEYRFFLLDWLK